MKRVVVGLSGGVDSSVAAHLLMEEGYEVIGLFMKNWHDESVTISNECPWVEDSNDALIVAQKLGIPFQTIDLSKEYKERVVDYMFNEYEQGRTPNPDVLCNREIKFDIFLKAAMKLGADFVATGHYCQKAQFEKDGQSVYQLMAGNDRNKDQSYFLCQLTQEQLSKALFPIGHLQKPEVRKIAKELDLITADKKDSQGICFVGKVKLPDFLQQKLKPKKGQIIEVPNDLEDYQKENTEIPEDHLQKLKSLTTPFRYKASQGKVVGNHNGVHYFTIGQRKGINVGGTPKPLFVLDTDIDENVLYTGQGTDHPGLYRQGLSIRKEEVHWVRKDLKMKEGDSQKMLVRIRYRQPLESATLFMEHDNLYIIFDNSQKGITPGQFAAWYSENELIGSGVIS
ncbi:tRNA 2-thiouridine(34) synthase MnmA [Xanthovirga aplysinae]|uniref:tRNA 2-thiouridine(34) synthase MnmA n=1 Tax=Xanthovirga aplysinae TaxID=2529853 RepID=UPI0012BD6BF5|nr:tRNA 2-thiouridine(34) synthase MnmA [Xanthovirga aplysinae]MTI33201.1 tRNA 2-thiouridine(34) synthase MnmA [Xanthovirga aplysinae]